MKRTFGFNEKEMKVFQALSSPKKIQDFLEDIPINFKDDYLSPRFVLQRNKAQCLEGALFAAAALMVHGQKPLLLDLTTVAGDQDHVVALFHSKGRWGAISKTNHAVLRYREPVYNNVRELAMSYFHEYFLDDGRKTLRTYSRPFDLTGFNKKNWTIDPRGLDYIADALDASPHIDILSKDALRVLRRADAIEIKAGKITEWKKPKR